MKTARQISAQVKASQKAIKPQLKKVVVDDLNLDNRQYNLDRVAKQFFIDRDGIIQKYTGDLKDTVISMHYRIASDLFSDITYPQSPDDHVTEKLGWVLVGSSVYTTPICYRRPTAAQLKTLQDLGDWYIKGLCFPYKDNMVSFDKYGMLCDD